MVRGQDLRKRHRRVRKRLHLRIAWRSVSPALVMSIVIGLALTSICCTVKELKNPATEVSRTMASIIYSDRSANAGACHRWGHVRIVDAVSSDDTDLSKQTSLFFAPSEKGCNAPLRWPVLTHVVTKKFKAPTGRFGSGHRGVDVAAVPGTLLVAPDNGIISFAGLVAGKSVVSIRTRSFTLTFEPAISDLPIGTPVIQGAPFATVSGLSDHCLTSCLHWGVRRGAWDYTNPELLADRKKIVLKAV
ncbi:peptidase, M23 family [Bifidobacterium bombi DSM 19703]|uniref:Peptidase, M23 family n=2 Tax=Bifidobacterium bombi TaxID=471511 RepID=A0A080N2B2_9BIFI|nr:peptidase, M23 family [Bifidobacterium bombi DSM 19703]